MATALSDESKHVVVIAFPFGSHPLALLKQTIRIACATPNVTFSFINTAKSNQSLFSRQPNIPHNIKPFNVSDGVPEDHVPGTPLPHVPVLVDLFLQASLENLEKAIDFVVESTNKKVTCIVSDTFLSVPSLSLSQKLNVPWIACWPSLSISVSPHFYTHLIRQNVSNSLEPYTNTSLDVLPGLSHLRVEDLPDDVLLKPGEEHKETEFSKALASLGQLLPQARSLVLFFYEELDPPHFVQDMKSRLKSLLYVGPPILSQSQIDDSNGCLPWLDKHSARSVAYLSFGTVAPVPHHELLEVSEALEESGIPFLWSLRDDQKRLLPHGFVERTSKKGKIVPWAPQTQVLAHGSVGVFVTHCGSNSVIEGMAYGVPMICRPFFGDHGMAARTVVDLWKIGVKIPGGIFTKNGLIQSLNLIFVEEEGKKISENALKMKKTIQNASEAEGKAAQDFKTLVDIITCS